MSVGLFEHWLQLTLDKVVSEAAETVAPGILVEGDGRRGAATESTEEWIRISVLGTMPRRERSGQWVGPVLLQVSVFSRYSEGRADAAMHRPRQLAGLLADEICEQHHLVKDFDSDAPAEKGTVWLPKPRLVRIDEQDIGQDRGRVPSGVHGQAMSIEGRAQLFA